MSATIEIIIPVNTPTDALERTISSLRRQKDRSFSVTFCADGSSAAGRWLETAITNLSLSGIKSDLITTRENLNWIEHANWAMTQARADWLKLLHPGEELAVEYISKVAEKIAAKPQAQIIRCDLALRTEWGTETVKAPFEQTGTGRGQTLDFFPRRVEWLARSSNFIYRRVAWLGLGGYSPFTPVYTELGLNVMLALHYGLENIPEPLVIQDYCEDGMLKKSGIVRANRTIELWLLLQQVKNYCLASKIPWTMRFLFPRAFLAARQRG